MSEHDELELEVNAEAVADEDPDDILEADELDEAAGDEIELETPEQPDSDDAIELDEADDVAPRGSRRQQRIRQLANETRLLKQKLAERDAENEQLKQWGSGVRAGDQYSPAAAEAELRAYQQAEAAAAGMPPEQRAEYWSGLAISQTQQALMRHKLEVNDGLDRVRFEGVARARNIPEQYLAAVEAGLQNSRSRGMNPSRQEILAWIVGQERLTNWEQALEREREQERIRQRRSHPQYVSPSPDYSSTGGVGPDRRRRSRDDEGDELLRNTSWREFSRSN